MRRVRTPRLAIYAIMAIISIIGGLAVGRPEPIAIGAAPLLLIGLGMVRTTTFEPRLAIDLDRDRALEGEQANLNVTITSPRDIAALEIGAVVPAGLRIERIEDLDTGTEKKLAAGATGLRVLAGHRHRLRFVLACDDWGAYTAGRLNLAYSEASGLFRHTGSVPFVLDVKVFPPELGLRSLLSPAMTQENLGELVSRRSGEGIEFADLRPYSEGDDARRVNWRASARRGHLWVNERHPERNSEVVLVIDPRSGLRVDNAEILDYAVRAAASVAAGHLGRRDRVGLLLIGGSLLWLRPRMFDLQRQHILNALAMSRSKLGGDPGPMTIAHRLIPPNALLIGLTPLLHEGAIAVFEDLVGRGHDTAIVEIDMQSRLASPTGQDEMLARRIWQLQREATRRRFRRRGVALATWDVREPFELALEEVIAFRKASRRVRV